MSTARRHRLLLLLAFFAIYVVWGSTYLAIRYAVETIPPLLTAATRHLLAGSVLYLWARRRAPAPTADEWRASLLLGALFFLLGHGLLHWAEQVVPSGLAALLVATEPIFIAVLAALPRDAARPSAGTLAGLALGTVGVGLLVGVQSFSLRSAEVLGALAVLGGALAWSVGIFYSRSPRLPRRPLMMSATSLLSGAALLLVTATLTGEPARLAAAEVTARSLLSLGYLVVFGSLIAFTAYTWLLEHCPPTLVATHTYVNPVVAVLLGWLWAGEPLTGRIVLAGALILSAIVLVGRGAGQARTPQDRTFAAELRSQPAD